MVLSWLWGNSSTTSNTDIKNLDPSLASILKSQDPSSSQQSPRPQQQTTTYTEQLRRSGDLPPPRATLDLQTQPQPHDASSLKPKVPPQSLYQDGRYAHLWANYEPQHLVESRGETELDKLKRLQEASESRKVALGQAALENCVFEQLAELDCLKNGGVAAKMTMCRQEKQMFGRCYEMQVKFLKALGYWDAVGTDSERADAIQMHSDGLWQRLKEQEAEIARAKEEGRPLPEFGSILSPENVGAVGGRLVRPQLPAQALRAEKKDESYAFPSIPRELRSSFDARIKDMSHEQAKVEEAVFLAETEQQRLQFTEASGYLRAEGDARRKRYESGEATLGDKIKKWTNWDSWDSQFPLPADAQARQQKQQEKLPDNR